jgi:hypothetical protein
MISAFSDRSFNGRRCPVWVKKQTCRSAIVIRFIPKADIVSLFNDLVCALLKEQWHVQSKLLRRYKID